MILAAGILIVAKDGRALFLKRGPGGDAPGEWCFPGGRIEDGETSIEAAIRETKEESGFVAKATNLTLLSRNISYRETTGAPPTPTPTVSVAAVVAPSVPIPPGDALVLPGEQVDFTTYLLNDVESFTPDIDSSGEHVAYAWSPPDQPPAPLHPGCRVALDRLSMDELGVARAIADGALTSPQKYHNVWLFDMRITGTGVAYRSNVDEFVYRKPEHYLTEEFLSRCNGLPVIWLHPKGKGVFLDSREFTDRIVGTMMLPYIKGQEVWGVAKVYDESAVKLMMKGPTSTSPAVLLRGRGNDSKMTLEDGTTLLIEGKPSLLDHLAICANGVWDKGGEPSGVANTEARKDSNMTDEEQAAADKAKKDAAEETEKKEAKEKADADAGVKLDKLLSGIDSVMGVCDSLSKRMDAFEMKEKERADAAMSEDDKAKADKKRKDSEDEEAKKKADADEDEKRKADAQKLVADAITPITTRISDMEKKLPAAMSDADFTALADAQARYDAVLNDFGKRAPRPLEGESVNAYSLRNLASLQANSPAWKDVDLSAIAATKAFAIAEQQIIADSTAAAMSPGGLEPGQLLERVTTDRVTGHRVINFVGNGTFVRGLKRSGQRARLQLRPNEAR